MLNVQTKWIVAKIQAIKPLSMMSGELTCASFSTGTAVGVLFDVFRKSA